METIRNILKQIGLELEETWNDSGIENCWSLRCNIKGTTEPTANGKGITKDFPLAHNVRNLLETGNGLFAAAEKGSRCGSGIFADVL